MKLDCQELNGSTVVSPAGEIDLQHSPRLRKALMDLMIEQRDVVVNLGGVDYIDSSGIASLVEAYQMARRNGSRFTLASISPAAMRVLQLARLDRVFAIAETVEAAIGAGAKTRMGAP
jgi:anti-sigma B factor antagonist